MVSSRTVPFNRPTLRGKESVYIQEALAGTRFAGGGPFTQRVESALAANFGGAEVFLTNSCTAALEIAALLTVMPGDEVVLPSFAYATTASSFARCGAKLVFVDIRPDTFNIDPRAVAAAIGPKTRAIVAVHYAGVGADVEELGSIAADAGLAFIEDAAQGFGATYRKQPLGTFGTLGAISFHETKNAMSGEGGALIVNRPELAERVRIIRDRGTNQQQFVLKQVEAYQWLDLGSAFAPSELVAAFLLAQVEAIDEITADRLRMWHTYHDAFEALEQAGCVRRPVVAPQAGHNGHIYHLLLADAARRPAILDELNRRGIGAVFHYVPLHSSPAGRRYGRIAGSVSVTEDVASRLVRLPLHVTLNGHDQAAVIDAVNGVLAR